MNNDNKIVFFPPEELKNIAPTYEAEDVKGHPRVYRRLSEAELRKYYLIGDDNADLVKKRLYLFTQNSLEEVKGIIKSYFETIGSLYNIKCCSYDDERRNVC